MDNIDKIIKMKVFEIFIVFFFIFGVTYVWYSLNQSEVFRLLESTYSTNFSVMSILSDNHYSLYPMDDNYAITHIMPSSILVRNDTYIDSGYAIGIRVSKSSSIDYHNVKVSFSSQVSFLSDFYFMEDADFYYFMLERGNLQASMKTLDIQMWLDCNSVVLANSSFIYEYINLKDFSF